jgi:hypothetical protein
LAFPCMRILVLHRRWGLRCVIAKGRSHSFLGRRFGRRDSQSSPIRLRGRDEVPPSARRRRRRVRGGNQGRVPRLGRVHEGRVHRGPLHVGRISGGNRRLLVEDRVPSAVPPHPRHVPVVAAAMVVVLADAKMRIVQQQRSSRILRRAAIVAFRMALPVQRIILRGSTSRPLVASGDSGDVSMAPPSDVNFERRNGVRRCRVGRVLPSCQGGS